MVAIECIHGDRSERLRVQPRRVQTVVATDGEARMIARRGESVRSRQTSGCKRPD
jgi:hypothetical protein